MWRPASDNPRFLTDTRASLFKVCSYLIMLTPFTSYWTLSNTCNDCSWNILLKSSDHVETHFWTNIYCCVGNTFTFILLFFFLWGNYKQNCRRHIVFCSQFERLTQLLHKQMVYQSKDCQFLVCSIILQSISKSHPIDTQGFTKTKYINMQNKQNRG